MINRRHIRVKVMQSVYALFQSKSDNLNKEEKFLMQSINKTGELHALILSLLVEIQALASNHLELSKKKLLVSPGKNQSTKFVDNRLIKSISDSRSLNTYLEDKKISNWKLDDEFVRVVWDLVAQSDLFSNYISSSESSFKEDKNFVIEIFKSIIAPNEKLADYFEGVNLTWVDDIPFVNTWIVKDLNGMKENKPFRLSKLYKDVEDEKFVLNLFRKVVLTHNDYTDVINDKTPNWDADRIADMDLILIKMALTEFIHFSSIPTSVTINEYIEISKDYSSQKSSFFINGVLDKILKNYKSEEKIKKVGRGLL